MKYFKKPYNGKTLYFSLYDWQTMPNEADEITEQEFKLKMKQK